MVITKEIDYAVRILRALAHGEQVPTPEICSQESLPIHFAYRIMKKLQRAGFVDIARGKEGGAQLIVGLDTINMYDLIGALGDRRYVSACTRADYICNYREKHDGKCGVHNSLNVIQNDLDNLLRARSLQTMIFEH
jgi:Rrf2 family protein